MAITTADRDLFRLYAGSLATSLTADEVDLFLVAAGESVARGVGLLYLTISGDAAVKAKVVKDYDLNVNTEKRPEELRETAARWFAQADREDNLAGANDIFEVHSAPGSSISVFSPEASPSRLVF